MDSKFFYSVGVEVRSVAGQRHRGGLNSESEGKTVGESSDLRAVPCAHGFLATAASLVG